MKKNYAPPPKIKYRKGTGHEIKQIREPNYSQGSPSSDFAAPQISVERMNYQTPLLKIHPLPHGGYITQGRGNNLEWIVVLFMQVR